MPGQTVSSVAMRGLTRRWVFRNSGHERGDMGLVDRLLQARGLTDAETVRRFCEPRLTDLHSPELLPGIDVASARLVDAVRRRETIVIYGDGTDYVVRAAPGKPTR